MIVVSVMISIGMVAVVVSRGLSVVVVTLSLWSSLSPLVVFAVVDSTTLSLYNSVVVSLDPIVVVSSSSLESSSGLLSLEPSLVVTESGILRKPLVETSLSLACSSAAWRLSNFKSFPLFLLLDFGRLSSDDPSAVLSADLSAEAHPSSAVVVGADLTFISLSRP